MDYWPNMRNTYRNHCWINRSPWLSHCRMLCGAAESCLWEKQPSSQSPPAALCLQVRASALVNFDLGVFEIWHVFSAGRNIVLLTCSYHPPLHMPPILPRFLVALQASTELGLNLSFKEDCFKCALKHSCKSVKPLSYLQSSGWMFYIH